MSADDKTSGAAVTPQPETLAPHLRADDAWPIREYADASHHAGGSMSAFEFLFTLYGLVLGLSVVEVVSGFARLAHERGTVKVGLLTPMLAVLLLLDLASFWVGAYGRFQTYDLTYATLVISLLIASLYYVAASVVFPRDFVAEPDLDAVFMRHRRLVMIILLVCGVLAFDLVPMLTAEGRTARLAAWTDPARAWKPLVFQFAAVAVIFVRDKRILLMLLAVMILPFIINFATTLPR